MVSKFVTIYASVHSLIRTNDVREFIANHTIGLLYLLHYTWDNQSTPPTLLVNIYLFTVC